MSCEWRCAVWRCGPLLLFASALLYLGLVLRQVGTDPARYGWLLGVMIAGTVLSAAYALLSPYARELFRGFPDAGLNDDRADRS